MKKSILLLSFFALFTASAQKIQPVQIGLNKIADSLEVRVLTFKTTDKTCSLYYQIFDCDKKSIDDGNLQLTEPEFKAYGQDNKYIEDLAISKLGFVRKDEN